MLHLTVWPIKDAVGAVPENCEGHDLLVKLKHKSPHRHEQIIERARSEINSSHMLWRISGMAEGVTSYILGTVHLSSSRLQLLSQATRNAILASRVVVLESRPISRAGHRRQMAHSIPLMLSRGKTLATVLDEDELEVVEKALDAAGLAPELVHGLKPWAASMFLARSRCEEIRQKAGLKPLDVVVAEFGTSNGLPLMGLESTLEQYQAMASLPDDAQMAWLKSSIQLSNRLEDMTETTARLYDDRLMPAIWDLTVDYSGEALSPEMLGVIRAALVDRRNLLMRDRAIPMLRHGAFIAVGALHLPGPGGLINLLRENGFTLSPVE